MAYVSSATGDASIEPLVCSCGQPTRREPLDAGGYRLVTVHCDRCGVVGWGWHVTGTRVTSGELEQAA
jgi:hypothetical protein